MVEYDRENCKEYAKSLKNLAHEKLWCLSKKILHLQFKNDIANASKSANG